MVEDQTSDRVEVTLEALETLTVGFRLRAYNLLLALGDMTGQQIAKHDGGSEAIFNQAMRSLAAVGLVKVINPEARARQRIWRAVRMMDNPWRAIRDGDFSRIERGWPSVQAKVQHQLLSRWLDVAPSWPLKWRRATSHQDLTFKALTTEQLTQFGNELESLLQRWAEVSECQDADEASDTRPVYVMAHVIPWPVKYQ